MTTPQNDPPLALPFSEGLGCSAQPQTRERQILFSAPMVRALLAGTKTQTRRHVKPQPETQHDGEPYWRVGGYRVWGYRPPAAVPLRAGGNPLPCPYGTPGERLWVRETWAETDAENGTPVVAYRAGGSIPVGRADPDGPDYLITDWAADDTPHVDTWRPSIFMPRWASRITLEVTSIRAERLNDIGRGDAMAEGCPFPNMAEGPDPRQWYAELWNAINGAGAWNANPWVWVVEFQRCPDLQPNVPVEPAPTAREKR